MARKRYYLGLQIDKLERDVPEESRMWDAWTNISRNTTPAGAAWSSYTAPTRPGTGMGKKKTPIVPNYLVHLVRNSYAIEEDAPYVFDPGSMINWSDGFGVAFYGVDAGDAVIPLGGPLGYCFKSGDLVFTGGKQGGKYMVLFNLVKTVRTMVMRDPSVVGTAWSSYIAPVLDNDTTLSAAIFETLVAMKAGKDVTEEGLKGIPVDSDQWQANLNVVSPEEFAMTAAGTSTRPLPPFFDIWKRHTNMPVLTPTLTKRIQDALASMTGVINRLTDNQKEAVTTLIPSVARALLSLGVFGPLQGKLMFGTLSNDPTGHSWCLYDFMYMVTYLITIRNTPSVYFRYGLGNLDDMHPAANSFFFDEESMERLEKVYYIGKTADGGEAMAQEISMSSSADFANLEVADQYRRMLVAKRVVPNLNLDPRFTVHDAVFESINHWWRTRGNQGWNHNNYQELKDAFYSNEASLIFTPEEKRAYQAIWGDEAQIRSAVVGSAGREALVFQDLLKVGAGSTPFVMDLDTNAWILTMARRAILSGACADHASWMEDDSLYRHNPQEAMRYSAVVSSIKHMTVNEQGLDVLWEAGFTGTGEGSEDVSIDEVADLIDPNRANSADIILMDKVNNAQTKVTMTGLKSVLQTAQDAIRSNGTRNLDSRQDKLGYLVAPLPLVMAFAKAIAGIVNLAR